MAATSSREIHVYHSGLDATVEITGSYMKATHIDPPEYPEAEITDVDIVDASDFGVELAEVDADGYNKKFEAAITDYKFSFGELPTSILFDYKGVRFTVVRAGEGEDELSGQILSTSFIISEQDFMGHHMPDSWHESIKEKALEMDEDSE